MEIIAHRGFSAEKPENTMASFDHALESGFPYLELDVHLSLDDILYVIHDDTIDRTTNGIGFIKELHSDEIDVLDAGSWFAEEYSEQRIPTLESILIRYQGEAHIFVEMKSDSLTLIKVLRDLLLKHGWIKKQQIRNNTLELHNVSIISFLPDQLLRSVSLNPEVNHGFLMIEPSLKNIEFCILNGIDGFFPYIEHLSQDVVTEAHDKRLFVGAWGFENFRQLDKAQELGIDGITIDWPSRASEYISK
jgi:glycerophosphoryl diester phosphodiesterase